MPKRTKVAGRQAGTPNRATAEIRAKFIELVEAELPTIREDLKALQPKERLEILLRFATFCVPKPEPVRLGPSEDDPAQDLAMTYKGFE